MKKIFPPWLILVVILLSTSCDGNEGTVSEEQLLGNWIWVQSTGGIAGNTKTPESTGKTVKIEINSGKLKAFTNGSLTNVWEYSVEVHESIFGGMKKMLVFTERPDMSFEISGNQLMLNEECFDCYGSLYIKE